MNDFKLYEPPAWDLAYAAFWFIAYGLMQVNWSRVRMRWVFLAFISCAALGYVAKPYESTRNNLTIACAIVAGYVGGGFRASRTKTRTSETI